jgi:hypothetical protein
MTRRVVAVGIVLGLAYVGAVLVTQRVDPFLARPILDGLAPPPLYRWVDPPPAFAATNQQPSSGRFVFARAQGSYDPALGSGAEVFATDDFQVSLAFASRAIAPAPGATAITVTVDPIAPSADPTLPSGYQIAGNVVHVSATYRPGGGRVTSLDRASLLTLSYPIVVADGFANVLLSSTDGKRWTALDSTDHPAQQSVLGTVHALGYFAVGQAAGSGSPAGAGATTKEIPGWLLPLLVVATVTIALLAVWVRRRNGPRSPRRPPPPDGDDRAFDPWEV